MSDQASVNVMQRYLMDQSLQVSKKEETADQVKTAQKPEVQGFVQDDMLDGILALVDENVMKQQQNT
jgi:hypothetical protein